MLNRVSPLVLCAASLALTAGCATTGTTTAPAPSTQAAPAAVEAPAPATSAPAASKADVANPNKGKVVEVIQAGRYSYISVDNGSEKTWFAVPSAEVKVGQQVEVKPGMVVTNYNAKSLNRTFENIIFSDELIITEIARPAAKKLPAYHPALGKTTGTTGGKSVAGKVLEVIKGSDYTYARVDQGETDTWVAVPAAVVVEKGQEVKFLPGQEVKNFGSSQLNRNFDKIIFSEGIDKK